MNRHCSERRADGLVAPPAPAASLRRARDNEAETGAHLDSSRKISSKRRIPSPESKSLSNSGNQHQH